MRNVIVSLASVLAFCSGAAIAGAQSLPLGGRLTVSISGAAQRGNGDITSSSTTTMYDEPAEIKTTQKIEGGALFDVGAAYRVTGSLGVGVSYQRLKSSEPASISGSIPHPLLYNQPRTLSATSDSLDHVEQAVHLQGIVYVPVAEKMDLVFSGGPSIFSVTQQFVTAAGVSFSEEPPNYSAVTVTSIDTVKASKSQWGFNVGAEATYAVTPMVGAAVMLRYTRASLNFKVAEGQTSELHAGDVQFGAGIRLRF